MNIRLQRCKRIVSMLHVIAIDFIDYQYFTENVLLWYCSLVD